MLTTTARKPCRSRQHPWSIAHLNKHQQRRAAMGNELVHCSIRAITLVNVTKSWGIRVRWLLEHPEDVGRTRRAPPASVWQLPEIRKICNELNFVTVAGHQCQFPGVDRKKPTRPLSDVKEFSFFGYVGWPQLDAGDQVQSGRAGSLADLSLESFPGCLTDRRSQRTSEVPLVVGFIHFIHFIQFIQFISFQFNSIQFNSIQFISFNSFHSFHFNSFLH